MNASSPALLDSLDREVMNRHPAFELLRDDMELELVSRTERCEKCATKIVAVRWGDMRIPVWCGLGETYQVGPERWRCRMVPHTSERCSEAARWFQPMEGALW